MSLIYCRLRVVLGADVIFINNYFRGMEGNILIAGVVWFQINVEF